MQVYVATLYRMAERNNESFVIGVFSDREKAKEAALIESHERSYKYGYEISEFEIDVLSEKDEFNKIHYPYGKNNPK